MSFQTEEGLLGTQTEEGPASAAHMGGSGTQTEEGPASAAHMGGSGTLANQGGVT